MNNITNKDEEFNNAVQNMFNIILIYTNMNITFCKSLFKEYYKLFEETIKTWFK